MNMKNAYKVFWEISKGEMIFSKEVKEGIRKEVANS